MKTIIRLMPLAVILAAAAPRVHAGSFCESMIPELKSLFGVTEGQLYSLLAIESVNDAGETFAAGSRLNYFRTLQLDPKNCVTEVRRGANQGVQSTLGKVNNLFSKEQRQKLAKMASYGDLADSDRAAIALWGQTDNPEKAYPILAKYLQWDPDGDPDARPEAAIASLSPELTALGQAVQKDPGALDRTFDRSESRGGAEAVTVSAGPSGRESAVETRAPSGAGIIAGEIPSPGTEPPSKGFWGSLWDGVKSVGSFIADGVKEMYNDSPLSRGILIGAAAFSAVALIATGVGAAPGAAILFGLWAGGTFGLLFGANFYGSEDEQETAIAAQSRPMPAPPIGQAQIMPAPKPEPAAAATATEDREWITIPGDYATGSPQDTLSQIVEDYYRGYRLTKAEKKAMVGYIARRNNLKKERALMHKKLFLPVDPRPHLPARSVK